MRRTTTEFWLGFVFGLVVAFVCIMVAR